MWTKKRLWELRRQVRLGSLYSKDYENSFGIDKNFCQTFFDGYMEYLGELMDEDGVGHRYYDYLSSYDTAKNLYNWYGMFDTIDPLPVSGAADVPSCFGCAHEDDDAYSEPCRTCLHNWEVQDALLCREV